VPVSAEPSDVTSSFLRRHVVRPKSGSVYETLEEKPLSVRVEEGRVSALDESQSEAVAIEVEIVYSETFYDSEFRALRIVNLAGFLSPSTSTVVPVDAKSQIVDQVWSRLGSSPRSDAAVLTLIDAGASAQLAKRLEKFEEMMKSTFSTAALARHGPLVQHSIGFFCKHAWELCNDTVSDMWSADGAAFCAARGVTRQMVGCAVEGVIMDRLYTVVMPLLCVMHADHDATLALAAACRNGESDTFGVPPEMRACLEEATAALDLLAQHTTPLGKLRCLQASVAVVSRQARLAKVSTLEPTAPSIRRLSVDPERPLSLTADELLPMLIAVILRSSVPNLSAHFSFIQFRQDKGSELSYYLTTIRAALEFIRKNVTPRVLLEELSPAEGTPGSASFAFDVPPSSPSPQLRLSPQLLAQAMQKGLPGVPPLEVKDRWFRLNKYRACWVASEFVDWIVQVHKLSREQATLLGRSVVLQGLARHVPEELDFRDDYLFFIWIDRRGNSSTESELSEKAGSDLLAQVRSEIAERRSGWTPSKQLASDMADPVSGLEIHDEMSESALRSFGRCFTAGEATAWLRRCRGLAGGEAEEVWDGVFCSSCLFCFSFFCFLFLLNENSLQGCCCSCRTWACSCFDSWSLGFSCTK
jgi:hypothetical protein